MLRLKISNKFKKLFDRDKYQEIKLKDCLELTAIKQVEGDSEGNISIKYSIYDGDQRIIQSDYNDIIYSFVDDIGYMKIFGLLSSKGYFDFEEEIQTFTYKPL